MFTHEIVFKIHVKGKITGLLNMCHCDLHLFSGKMPDDTEGPKSLVFIHGIFFKI